MFSGLETVLDAPNESILALDQCIFAMEGSQSAAVPPEGGFFRPFLIWSLYHAL